MKANQDYSTQYCRFPVADMMSGFLSLVEFCKCVLVVYVAIFICILYFFQTWKNEGFFALYKGFWPNWLRLGPWNIIVSF